MCMHSDGIVVSAGIDNADGPVRGRVIVLARIAKKPHRPREQNILRLYELVGIPVPEGRSPRSTEDEETWGNESLLVKRWMKKVKKKTQQRKRTLLQALETEVAYIEMLLKAKGDLAAKKAWNAAWQHSGAGQAVDRFDTCPMEAGLAEEVLEAARIEVHRREVEQSMQDESQREPALSAELRGTTLVLGQAPEDPEEPHPSSERMPDDDNATIFFDPETMACLEGTGGPGDEKPIPGFVGGGEPHHDKPAEKPEALVCSDEPNDDEPADDDEPEALVGSGEADDDKSEALDGSGEPDFEPEEALFGSGEPDDDKSEALDGSGEPNDDKPDDDEALGGSGEADDDESEADDDESEPLDVSGEPDDAKPNASVGKGGPSPESSGSVQPPLPKPACAKDFTVVGPAQQHSGKKGGGRGKGAKQRPDEVKALTGRGGRGRGNASHLGDGKELSRMTKPNDPEKPTGKTKPNERKKATEKTKPNEPKKGTGKTKKPNLETEKGSRKTKPAEHKKPNRKVEKPTPKRKHPELTEEERSKKALKSRKSCAYHWARLEAINLGFDEAEAKKKGQEVL
ncbi:hypothetical protein AK812_SmicGene9281 [Symbiodinium microadriaticum]|uniref:Uncharacterized protein n=1 Tax=Symbiodinium microadriaticum TaxID=2951 RepID=A0A1Q9EIU1_SYMMI|nr:hypothetical protein AK812_SmicGene9281 [Symbiodinium microadriaticum]